MEDRKGQIIQIATNLIKEYGYDSFSYKDLSEAVGITKATLHHHFAKKEDLGIAVLQTIKDQLTYLEEKTFEIDNSSERLEFMFARLRDTVASKDICPISSMQAEYNVIPDALKTMISEISGIEIRLLTRILEAGQNDGSFNFQGVAGDKALMLMTSYKGAIMYARANDPLILERVLEGIVKSVIS